jgi:hypothetical protein
MLRLPLLTLSPLCGLIFRKSRHRPSGRIFFILSVYWPSSSFGTENNDVIKLYHVVRLNQRITLISAYIFVVFSVEMRQISPFPDIPKLK